MTGVFYGFGGYAESGKDTVADFLVEHHGFYKTYMSKPLEIALLALDPYVPTGESVTGWMRYSNLHAKVGYERSKKNSEVRMLLQRLGTEVGRNMIHEDVWVDVMLDDVRSASEASAVVTGVRYRNELDAVHEANGYAVWIDRGLAPVNSHSSDNSLGPEDFDIVLNNRGSLSEIPKACLELLDQTLDGRFEPGEYVRFNSLRSEA